MTTHRPTPPESTVTEYRATTETRREDTTPRSAIRTSHQPTTRRRPLLQAALLGALGLAGCLDGGPSGTPTETPTATATDTPTPTPTPPSGDWPAFQRDARRQGTTTDPGPKSVPSVRWAVPAGADSMTATAPSPAVVDGVVFFGREDGAVAAVDAQTGEERWTFQTGARVDSSPAVADGTVYVGSRDGSVYALDAATGEERWTFATGDEVFSSPAVVDGTVYVGSWDMYLYALDAASGEERWTQKVGTLGYSSPAVTGGRVFCGSGPREFDGDSYVVAEEDKRAYAFDAATGEQRWAATLDNVTRSSPPTVAGGVVYLGCEDDRVYALNAKTGERVWRREVGFVGGSPAVADGKVYIAASADGGGTLFALDTESGETIWETPLNGSPGLSSPVVADGLVYVGDDSEHVQAFDAESGEKQWELYVESTVDSSPAVVDGTLYVSTASDVRALA